MSSSSPPVWTCPGRNRPHDVQSPGLLFDKWHAYDDFDGFTTKESRVRHLEAVCDAVQAAHRRLLDTQHATPLARLEDHLAALPAQAARGWTFRTTAPLVVGLATNPVLETGLTLHPLYGVPMIPGSALKGVARRAAEAEILGDLGEFPSHEPGPEEGGDPEIARLAEEDDLLRDIPLKRLDEILTGAERVKSLFGSLFVERATDDGRTPRGPFTPRSLLRPWLDDPKRREKLTDEQTRRLTRLLHDPTGGRLCFYDALPSKAAKALVRLDVMTPHYPDFYNSQGGDRPPSDDQDPVPVTFLVVAEEVDFPVHVRLVSRGEDDDAEAPEDLLDRVEQWLAAALEIWGVGAKTAAGYGRLSKVSS